MRRAISTTFEEFYLLRDEPDADLMSEGPARDNSGDEQAEARLIVRREGALEHCVLRRRGHGEGRSKRKTARGAHAMTVVSKDVPGAVAPFGVMFLASLLPPFLHLVRLFVCRTFLASATHLAAASCSSRLHSRHHHQQSAANGLLTGFQIYRRWPTCP